MQAHHLHPHKGTEPQWQRWLTNFHIPFRITEHEQPDHGNRHGDPGRHRRLGVPLERRDEERQDRGQEEVEACDEGDFVRGRHRDAPLLQATACRRGLAAGTAGRPEQTSAKTQSRWAQVRLHSTLLETYPVTKTASG